MTCYRSYGEPVELDWDQKFMTFGTVWRYEGSRNGMNGWFPSEIYVFCTWLLPESQRVSVVTSLLSYTSFSVYWDLSPTHTHTTNLFQLLLHRVPLLTDHTETEHDPPRPTHREPHRPLTPENVGGSVAPDSSHGPRPTSVPPTPNEYLWVPRTRDSVVTSEWR